MKTLSAEGSSGTEHTLAEGQSNGSHRVAEASSGIKPPLAAPRKRAEAALRFLSWARDNSELGCVGEHYWTTRHDLPGEPIGVWEMYLWHCRDENTTPLPPNMFAFALKTLRIPKRLESDCSTGRQIRWTVYYIPDGKEIERHWLEHGELNAEDSRPH